MLKISFFVLITVFAGILTNTFAQSGDFQINEKKFEEKNAKMRYEMKAAYPQIAGDSAAVNKFNQISKDLAMSHIAEFRKSMAEFTDEDRNFLPEDMNYEIEISYQVSAASNDLVSVIFSNYESTGGAHPNTSSFALNYDLKNNRQLELKDLFIPSANYLKQISTYSLTDLKKRTGEMSDSEWLQNGAGPKAENYKSWTIANDGLHFLFDSYQVAAYAAGNFEVIMPYSKIPENIRTDVLKRAVSVNFVGDNPRNWCRNVFFPKANYISTGKVTGVKNAKIFFYGDDKDCPTGENCRAKSYVIPGDEVLAGEQYGSYTCVWYQRAKGDETVGWIETSSLELGYEDPEETKNRWTGKWVDGQNEINFAPAKLKGAFVIAGNAMWQGAGDNVHVGEIEGTESPEGNEIKIGAKETDEFACKVSMKIVGKYLIVSDNMNCGGANVSFTGVYKKTNK